MFIYLSISSPPRRKSRDNEKREERLQIILNYYIILVVKGNFEILPVNFTGLTLGEKLWKTRSR